MGFAAWLALAAFGRLANAEEPAWELRLGVPGLSWYAGTGAVSPLLSAHASVSGAGLRASVHTLAAPIHLLEPDGGAWQLSAGVGAERGGPVGGGLVWRAVVATGRVGPLGPETEVSWGQALFLGYRSDDEPRRSLGLDYLVDPTALGRGEGALGAAWLHGQGVRGIAHLPVPRRDRMWAGIDTGLVVGGIRWWSLLVGWSWGGPVRGPTAPE